MTVHPEYLVDTRGARRSVVLPVKEFFGLMEHLEDLEDALDLKKAKKAAKEFVSLADLKAELKAKGALR